MKNEPMDEIEIENIARAAISDAIDFVDSEIADDRIKAQRYYNGECDIGDEEGRSSVVATKVRDTIRAIKPSLMRVFLSSENYVEFVPKTPYDVQTAETATRYIQAKFSESNGYRVLSDAIHDALLKKTGIVKAYWDEYDDTEMHEYSDLTESEMLILAQEPDVEIIEHETEIRIDIDQMGVEIQTPYHSMKIMRQSRKGKLCVESVPPEEFFVDRDARSIDDCYVVGHRNELRAGDLIAMGYDPEIVDQLSGLYGNDVTVNEEEFARRGFDSFDGEQIQDPSMRLVAVTECYMRIDADGTGVPQMHRILMGGDNYKLLDFEPCSHVPFAVFECDPEPHTFFGHSVADLIINDQDASTAMLRGVLDNIAMTNNPRLAAVNNMVNMDDLLNNEIGGIVRVRQPDAVVPLAVPFTAGQTLAAIEYYDQTIESKTGVSRASAGLDPDALQNTTATAAQLTAQAAAGQVEVIARNIAEGGMSQLFRNLLRLVVENSNEAEMMRLNGGSFVQIDPRAWDTSMGITVNVGLGTGKEDQKAAALQSTLQTQLSIIQGYGLQNGLVGLTNVRNTLADILSLGGMRNADRYYQPMTPEIEAQLAEQQRAMAEQQGQQQIDQQAQALVQAETIKAQQRAQTDALKLELEAQKALAADDRERDQMDQDLLVKAAEILGRYGIAVDTAQIKAMQNAPRYPDQVPTQAATGARF